MSDPRIDLTKVLEMISDEGFLSLKERFAKAQGLFILSVENTPLKDLLSIICEPDLLTILSRPKFAKVLSCLTTEEEMQIEKLEIYAKNIHDVTISDSRTKKSQNNDVKIYYQHFEDELIPTLMKSIKNEEKQDEIIRQIVDIYKTALCIKQYYEADEFIFMANIEMLYAAEKRIYDYTNIPSKPYDKVKVHYSPAGKKTLYMENTKEVDVNHRNFTLFLTMILSEIICDQDGISRREVKQENE